MLKINKWRVLLVFFICLTGVYFLIPNLFNKSEVTALPSYLSKKQVNLGLDLQGGSHLLLEVDTNVVLKEKSEYLVDDIRSSLRKSKIKYSNLGSKVKGAIVTITDSVKVDLARDVIRKNIDNGINIKTDSNKLILSFSEEFILNSNNQTVDQSIEVVRKRVDESGTKEPIIQKQGEKKNNSSITWNQGP